MTGKRKEWEGISLLPMVDYTLVRDSYLQALPTIDRTDLERNKRGITKSYTFNGKKRIVKNICIE